MRLFQIVRSEVQVHRAQFQLQLYAGILERAELGILCRLCHYEASIGGGHDGKLLSKMGISQAYIGPLVLWWAGKSGVVGTVTMSSQYGNISLCFVHQRFCFVHMVYISVIHRMQLS